MSQATDNSFFDCYNRFVRCGWMAVVSATAKDVFHAYLSHAGADGIAWPAPSTIAKYMGHASGGHIRRARAELVRLGLLVRIDTSGGRSAGKFRVVVPEIVPTTLRRIGARSESALGPNPRRHPTPNRRNHPTPNPRRHPTPNRRTEGLNEGNNEETSNSSGIAAADSSDEDGGHGEALEAIYDSGIQEPTASKLVEQFPTITAADVQSIMAGMSASAGAGARVEAIRTNAGRIIEARSSRQREHRARTEAAERARGQIADATANVKAAREAVEHARGACVAATTRRDEAARAWVRALPATDLESIAAARRESDPTIRSLCTADRLRIASAMTLDIVVELWAASAPEQAASFIDEARAATEAVKATELEYDRADQIQRRLQSAIDSADAPRARYRPERAIQIEVVNPVYPTPEEVEAIL